MPMSYLIDTSILVRYTSIEDPDSLTAVAAVSNLHRQGEDLHITGQNIIEFWNVATRPKSVNRLGITPNGVNAITAMFANRFPVLEDTPQILAAWKALVVKAQVMGTQVHDARLVAVCQV